MNFAFSEEQEAFRETLGRFLAEKSPSAEVRRLSETPEGYDPVLWRQMAEELGLQGIHLPEAYGGQGFGFLELGIVQEAMGRVLLPSPYFASTCLAASAILNVAGEEERRELLPGIACGETIASLAVAEPGGGWEAGDVAMTCEREGAAFRLDGVKCWVIDGQVADLILVVARRPGSAGDDGLSLFAVRAGDEGVSLSPVEPLDATRKLAELALTNARARLLGAPGAAGPGIARTLQQAAVALACEMSGGAQRCLEMAVAYAKERVQFGRPIGSFQAIKHRCADLLLEIESAKVAASYASWVAAEGGEELPRIASLAKSLCADTYLRSAADNLHIHGGMGFSWEADPHLFLKRAQSSATLLGDPVEHRRKLAEALGF